MLDWLGKMLQLPQTFLAENQSTGGGVIQVRPGGARLLGCGPPGASAVGSGWCCGGTPAFLWRKQS